MDYQPIDEIFGRFATLFNYTKEVSMNVKYQIKRNKLIVYLKDDIDHHSTEKLRLNIDSLIDSSDITTLVIDFGSVKFIDSSGIGLILGRYKKLKTLDGRIEIVNTTSQVRKLLRMASIETLMPVY